MPTDSAPSAPGRLRHRPWMLACLLPLGVGAWVPLVAGVRARRPPWTALGALWCALVVAGFVLSPSGEGEDGSFAGMLIILGWVGAVATTAALYTPFRRRRELLDELDRQEQAAQADALRSWQQSQAREREHALRQADRERARALVQRDPVGALERGVGRPDLPGADHGQLVDVNHAPEPVLATLPGIDAALARRIVSTREDLGQFSSVADLAFVLDLDPDTVERLERAAIAIDA